MLWWLTLAGCILGPKPETCSDNSDCRKAFGFGYTCAQEGLCAPAELNDRCTRTYPEDVFANPLKYKDAVVIGSVFSHEFDPVQLQAAELAVRQYSNDEANEGSPVAVVHCDSEEDVAYDDLDVVEAAGEVTRYLEQLDVPVVVGPSTSDEAFAAFDAARSLTIISPSATSPELSEVEPIPSEEEPGQFWRTVPPDDLQTFAIAEDMRLRGVTDVFIVYEDNSYARPLATGVADLVQANGAAADLVVYTGAENFQLSTVPDDAEVFFVSSLSEEVGNFLDLLGAAPSFDGTVFLADAAADPALFEVSADARSLFPVIRGTRPQVLGEDYDPYTDFVGNYSSVYPEGPSAESNVYASYSFDASWMALFAVEWARSQGKVDGASVSTGLLHLSGEGDAVQLNTAGLQQARAAFADGGEVDVFGASGALTYVDGEVVAPIEVWTLDPKSSDFVVDLICDSQGTCNPPQ